MAVFKSLKVVEEISKRKLIKNILKAHCLPKLTINIKFKSFVESDHVGRKKRTPKRKVLSEEKLEDTNA